VAAILDGPEQNSMIITDTGIRDAGLLGGLETSLAQSGVQYTVFDAVEPNPRDTTIHTAAKQVNEANSAALVAIGGGSVMDAAKAIGVVAKYGGAISDYDGLGLVPGPIAPLFAIPTTAGTASEVTVWAVITNTETKVKMGIGDLKICPAAALVDPAMTYTLPKELTVGTGLDALTHAIESYMCRIANPVSDALALKAINLIAEHLVPAATKGDDKVAREGMMLGSLIAGMSFSNTDVTGVHCLSEALGGVYDAPHGMLNAIFLPYVMAYNLPEIPARFTDIALAMGLEARPEAAIEWVVEVEKDLGVPNLSTFGVRVQDAGELGKIAEAHPSTSHNIRQVTAEDYQQMIEATLEGQSAI
jgi:alcohol dehydrogenase